MAHRLTSEEALEVLDTMDVAVMIADIINGGSWVTWVNPAFTRVFGYTLEEMIDGAIHRIIGPNTDEAETERMYAEVRKGNRSTITTVGYCADGTEFWSTFTASPVFVAGRVVRWIGVQHDVSEHVRRVSEHVLRSEQDRRSYEVERRARIGLSVVGEVSDIMADVDDPYVLRSVVQLLRRRLVSWAGFFVADEGGLREVETLDGAERRRRTSGGPDAAAEDPVVAVGGSTKMARGYVDLNHDHPPGSPADVLASRLRAHRERHPVAADRAIVVPVVGRRRPLGVLAVLPRSTDARVADSAAEIATIVELVARRVGLAMENTQLFAREHRLAETLQRAMLPEQAHIAGLDVWTYYAPNLEHAEVGGDWYDVVHVAPDTVGIVVGDVAGHDVEAAAAMGQLRSIVRAYAGELVEPATVLSRVDRLMSGMRFDRVATLVYATMVRLDGHWALTYSLAGHLPPLVVHRDGGGVEQLDDASGLLIGCGTPERRSATVHLDPGDVLVCYTDGLIERRDRSQRQGVADLIEQCRNLTARDAARFGEELVAQLAETTEDDVAVVVVRVPDPSAEAAVGRAPRSRRWQLPAERQSVGRARHAVLSTCAAWGIEDTGAVELVVSELVANAVVHGGGKVGVHLAETEHGLRIEVSDSNPTPPATRRGRHGRIGGYGMHIVSRLASWGWQPSGAGKVVWAVVRPGDRGGSAVP